MDRKSKAIHPDKCSACLLPLPAVTLWIHKRARHSSGHRRSTSGLGNLSSFETHQWGEGGMARESNGSCLEGSEGNRVRWRSTCRHVLKEQLKPSFIFTGGCGPVRRVQSKSTIKQEFSEYNFFSEAKGVREWCPVSATLALGNALPQSLLLNSKEQAVEGPLSLCNTAFVFLPSKLSPVWIFDHHGSSVKTPTP